jgi:hypothetical protein
LETLVRILDEFDFAILACLPDDVVIDSAGQKRQMPRDNVLLELGMFIGRLGPNRVFMVMNREAETKMPSDLAGITPASFVPPQAGNTFSALGAACTNIKAQIKELGKRKRQRQLKVSATQCGEHDWSGIGITIENNDTQPLPPHNVELHDGRNHTVRLNPAKTGELLSTQKRRYTLPLFYGEQQIPGHLLKMFTKPADSEETKRWTLLVVLEDSETILFEDAALGKAIGDVLVRANEIGSLFNVEHDVAIKMYRPE